MTSFMRNLAALCVLIATAAVLYAIGAPSEVAGLALAAVVQSSYSERMTQAVAGMAANMTNWDADTRNCETAAGIGFGLAVGQGVANDGAILGGSLATFVGISVRDITLVPLNGGTVDEYAENQNMAVANEGDWWVQTSVAVLVTDPVHYDETTGIFKVSGGSGPIVGARWMKDAATGPALLRLSGSLPVP